MSSSGTGKALNICPTNVKEALDWLQAFGPGASQCAQIIKDKKIIEGFDDTNGYAKKLCDAAHAFLEAIKNGNGGVSYPSIYQGAQWTDLCQTGTGGTSCCASSGGQGGCNDCSDPSNCAGCCKDCPQQICARIFCLIVPVLFKALMYLYGKCNKPVKGKTGEWSDQNINNGNGGTDLKEFMISCGFDTWKLNSINGSALAGHIDKLSGSFPAINAAIINALQNDQHDPSKNFLKDASTRSSTLAPMTIADMCLWLYFLPYCTNYKKVVKELKTNANKFNGINGTVDDQLQITLSRFSHLFHVIEGKGNNNGNSLFQKIDKLSKCEQIFKYEEENGKLLHQFCEYVYKIHTQLRFLMTMCNTGKNDGGWKECIYSNKHFATSSGIKCTCSSGHTIPCNNSPLRHFLNSTDKKNQYKQGNELVEMGFKNTVSTDTYVLTGKDIYDFLKDLIDDIPTPPTPAPSPPTPSKPLSLLTQYCVAIGRIDPSSLGDLFAFFLKLGSKWTELKLYGNNNGGTFKNKLEAELNGHKIGENGDKQACSELKTKIKAILNSEHTEHESKKSLMSLMCTPNTSSSNSCAPYMKSLSQGVYHFYQLGVEYQEGQFHLLQYLYDMLRKLLDKMKELQNAFNECECCKTGSSGKSCDGLISCQYAHPILYKFGFVFGDPSKLKSGTKKCETLKDQLDAVLSCKKDHESALFKAFECVIQVTYKVLLERAKEKVNGKYDKNSKGQQSADGLKSTKEEMNTAFMLYVENAMYQSYPRLICTFACKVFDGSHTCQGDECKDRFLAKVPEPNPKIPASTSSITVSSTAVTLISPIIPQYTAPVIDPYHYRTYKKATTTDGKASNHYSFKDAIDFHVKGANCIRPTPVALRSVIDWILRITVGVTDKDKSKDENNNDNIKALCDAIKSVLEGSGTTDTEVNNNNIQSHLTDLVSGLRKFVGYEDKSDDVIKKVGEALGTNGTNGVKKLLGDEIKKIEGFIGTAGKENFGKELGKALLKGQYAFKETDALETLVDIVATLADTFLGTDNKKNIHVRKNFKDVVKTFTEILKSEHKNCTATYCKDFNKDSNSTSSSNGPNAEGLSQLHTFFTDLQKFAALWDSIGNKNGGSSNGNPSSSVVHTQKTAAMNAKWTFNGSTGSSSVNGEYFNKLHQALTELGKCADKVQALENTNGDNGSVTDSKQYRTKITALITGLNAFNTALNGTNSDKADPQYAVKGAEALIKKTVSNVEAEITKQIKGGVEGKFVNKLCDEQKQPEHTSHHSLDYYLCIQQLILDVMIAVSENLITYRSHLDDLKRLCQWLYRMGQLYAHGLKGFVESLVKHLEHIVQVIRWIEKLHKNLDCLNNKIDKYGTEDSIGFTRLSVRYIEDLLHRTYVLDALPQSISGIQDDSDQRRQLLHDLRLLALDRYTLQVWQDECNDKDNCRIKDWITFENGIVRHSDLNAIKAALQNLTGVAYNNASSTPRNRIQNFHAICVIQKFSYEAPIAQLERSLKELEGIKDKLSEVKQKCQNGQQLHTDPTVIKPFCTLVSQFLKEPYGVYSFAKFVHTILGPNIFSAVIAALEELTSDKYQKNNGNGNLDKIKGILGVMTEGLESDAKNNTKDDHYKLGAICDKLEAFITTLKKEYIFSYPVVTCTAQQQAGAATSQPQALTTASPPSAQNILQQLKSVTPPCPSDFHTDASVCNDCYNVFAYILLGQVPKLYHSFRFMSWMLDNGWKVNPQGAQQADNRITQSINKKITSYLVSMGFNIGNIQNGSTNTGGKQLHETFKSAVSGFKQNASTSPSPSTPSYEPNGLKEIHDMLEELLKKLIGEQHEQALQSIANGGTDTRRRPRTIREMLHWLSGVPFSVVYSEMQQVSTGLCDSTLALDSTGKKKHNIKPEPIEYRLGVSCAECLDVLQAIEDPLGKEPTKRFEAYIKASEFYYPASASELFHMFVDVIYYVYVHMKFVCNMTGRDKTEGGWERCEFVRDDIKVVQQYNKHNIQCECLGSFIEHRCDGPLHRLLCSVSTVFTGRSLGFQLPKEKLYSASVVGSAIHNVIKHIFGSSNNYSVLCRLLLAVSSCPPTSIGDMICFLYWYRNKMFPSDSAKTVAAQDAQKYKNALHQEIELFPGTFDPRILTNALGALMSEHGAGGGRTAGGTTHNHNMLSILDCLGSSELKAQAPAPAASPQQTSDITCAPYLRPLAYDIYKIYVPQFSRAYLSWILHFGPRVYTALEEIKGKLNVDCKHCSDKNNNNSIVTCNGVLPELYSKGLDFWDPKILNGQKYNKEENKPHGAYQPNGGTKRTCTLFATQLDAVLRTCNPGDPKSPGAPLHKLIEAIEQFLWSIRLPFSLVQLSLWSVAILFISYVFVVPLDHFKIKSHLFNRLKYTMHPSLLIADGQRRVSEVAYFSL